MRRKDRRQAKNPRQIGSGVLALGAALAAAQSAEAAAFNVTNLNDSGAGSLRQAVLDANAAAGADTIGFQTGLTGTITLTSGQIQITDAVQLQGPGPATLAVSGNNASRVFYIYDPADLTPVDVTISHLTITAGFHAGSGNIYADIGGAIAAIGENLTLDDVVISDSTSTDGSGGGVSLLGKASSAVGAPEVDAVLTIDNSTVRGNTAQTTTQGGGSGGGVAVDRAALIIRRTTVSGNTATTNNTSSASGGGIVAGNKCGTVIENSTVANNTAERGGGIFVGSGATPEPCFTIRHTTISGNSAGQAGGLFVSYAHAAMDHSILADNLASYNPDLLVSCCTYYQSDFNVSFSLIETPGTEPIIDDGGNIFSQDPQLGPLQDNGGPTQTSKPAPTSPAVNAGNPAFTPPPSVDQRGLARVAGGGIDMGSVELQPSTVQFAVAAESFNESAGTVTISVTRTGSDGAASVQVSAIGGTATGGGTDFTFAGATLNWADNDATVRTFDITINDDGLFEGDETIVLQLSAPTIATIGTPSTETVTVVDDDVASSPIPTLSPYAQLALAAAIAAVGLAAIRKT